MAKSTDHPKATEITGEVELGAVDSPPAIVTRNETSLIATARSRLVNYLRHVTGKTPVLSMNISKEQHVIALGDFSLAEEYGLTLPNKIRPESFTIAPIIRKKQTLLLVCGKTDHGVKQGIHHILRNITLKKDKLVLMKAIVQSTPFIAWRGSEIGSNLGRASPEQEATKRWWLWDVGQITDYVDMLDFFGYNLLETDLSRPGVKTETFVKHARQNGMRLQTQSTGTLLNPTVPYGSDTHQQYVNEYNMRAEADASYLDTVLTHWVDPGGWKSTPEHPCRIDLLQDLHMLIHRAYRRANPKIESILSLWWLDHPNFQRWEGYEGLDTILKSGKIPSEVGFAMSRFYRPDEATRIVAAGHKAGVWGWYIADHELLYTMHVHTHLMRKYFHSLPDEAGDLLEWHNLDNCNPDVNIYSIYVGARLMWNPREEPEVYLREIARLIFGPKLEEAVFQGLKAVANVRCGKGCRRGRGIPPGERWEDFGGGCWDPDWKPGLEATVLPADNRGMLVTEAEKRLAALHEPGTFNGVVTFGQAYDEAITAWEALKDVEIDKTYTPPIRFHLSTEELLQQLKGHVEAVAKYMQFLEDRQDRKEDLTEVPSSNQPYEYYERRQYTVSLDKQYNKHIDTETS